MPIKTCDLTGTFEYYAVIDRYCQRLDMPRTYRVDYRYSEDDLDSVRYTRILDGIGNVTDVSDLHGSSLFHAFKVSVANSLVPSGSN